MSAHLSPSMPSSKQLLLLLKRGVWEALPEQRPIRLIYANQALSEKEEAQDVSRMALMDERYSEEHHYNKEEK